MPLNAFQRFAYRTLGRRTEAAASRNPRLANALQRAHIPLRPAVYMAMQGVIVALVFFVGLLVIAVIDLLALAGAIDLPTGTLIALTPLPLVLATVVHLLGLAMPELRAVRRARDIDAKLPYALNYIATMASAGTTPVQIFRSLARQPLYKEVANEAAWITRDVEVLGADLLTALNNAMQRTPSIRFQDFLQGSISALSSGTELKVYFIAKSEQYLQDSRQDQRNFLEGLGVLAESFVVVVVAAPLFLIVILSIMVSFGSDARQSLILGYMLVLLMLPLAQFAYALTIKASTPEV